MTPTLNPPRKKSPYVSGHFAPVDEERSLSDLTVIGEIPRELSGSFVRNSPNPRFEPQGKYHWFDGDGMIHGVSLKDGKAFYRNKYIRTKNFQMEEDAGHALWKGILEPIEQKNADHPDKDTGNTSLIYHNGTLFALWWLGGEPYRVRLPSLETDGVEDFKGSLTCGFAAHPKIDPVTGEMVFFDFSYRKQPFLTTGVISPDGKMTHVTDVEIPGPRLFHDVAITRNYTILMDLPLLWHPDKLEKGKRITVFDRNLPSRFGILGRHSPGNTIRWFETDPCYIFHTINAWEEGDEIVLYACRIENPVASMRHDKVGKTPRLEVLELTPRLCKFRFNLKTGSTHSEFLDEVWTEFPRMNDDFLSNPSKFSYNPRLAKRSEMLFDGLIKYDFQKDTNVAHDYGSGRFGGEAVFAPRPGATNEDDGWVMTMVTDTNKDTGELLILNGQDMSVAARVQIPCRVPIGFHAAWAAHD